MKGLNFKYVDSDYNPNCFANKSGKTPSAIIDAIINTATMLYVTVTLSDVLKVVSLKKNIAIISLK